MSTPNEKQAAFDAAFGELMTQGFQPVFFDRLKQAGIEPRNEHEANQLLNIGQALFQRYQGELSQQQAKQASLYDLALAELSPGSTPQNEVDHFAKQAAAYVMQQPNLVAAGSRVLAAFAEG